MHHRPAHGIYDIDISLVAVIDFTTVVLRMFPGVAASFQATPTPRSRSDEPRLGGFFTWKKRDTSTSGRNNGEKFDGNVTRCGSATSSWLPVTLAAFLEDLHLHSVCGIFKWIVPLDPIVRFQREQRSLRCSCTGLFCSMRIRLNSIQCIFGI